MNILVDQHPYETVLDIRVDEIRGAQGFQPHLNSVNGAADRDRAATADDKGRWRKLGLGVLTNEASQPLCNPRTDARQMVGAGPRLDIDFGPGGHGFRHPRARHPTHLRQVRQTGGALIKIGLKLLGGRPPGGAVVKRIEAVNVASLNHRFMESVTRRRRLGCTGRGRRGHRQYRGDARQNPLPGHVIPLAL
ncbi:hypothetical protein D3C80_1264610 [compost metagenome]